MYANQCFENSRSHISPFWSGWLTKIQLGSTKGLLLNKQEVILSSCLIRFLYKARDIVLHCFISVRDRAVVCFILPRLHHDQAGPRSHTSVRATLWLQPDHRYVKQKQSRPRGGRDNVRLQWHFDLKRSSNTGKELSVLIAHCLYSLPYILFLFCRQRLMVCFTSSDCFTQSSLDLKGADRFLRVTAQVQKGPILDQCWPV